MVGAAGQGPVPGWGRTDHAEPGAARGHRMGPVGLGILEEPLWLIQAVTQREAVWGICPSLAFSLAEVNYSTLCTPAPWGTCHPV